MRSVLIPAMVIFTLCFALYYIEAESDVTEEVYFYENNLKGKKRVTEVTITELCHGVPSTTLCCERIENEQYKRKSHGGVERVSVETARADTRVLAFYCLKMHVVYGANSNTPSYAPMYDGPYAIMCDSTQVARLANVTVIGLRSPQTREPLVITIGHCVNREARRTHTVLGGTNDCLDVPRIYTDDTDNVIYAWFTDDMGTFKLVEWVEIRASQRNVEEGNSAAVGEQSVKRWHRTAVMFGPVVSELMLGMNFEVCILAEHRSGADTVINVRLGEEGEEDINWDMTEPILSK